MLFAIADLHLSHGTDKPMDVFGDHWSHHTDRIARAWRAKVSAADTVLLPGDLSWAMTLAEAAEDLAWIGRLPGKKVILRGNHDYWWGGIGKVRRALPPDVYAIQNDALLAESFAICGTRGWLLPSHPRFTEEDMAIYRREGERLRLSLQQAKRLGRPLIAMMHFPPCGPEGEETLFTQLLEAFGVKVCVYGHLHGPAHRYRFEGWLRGVWYQLVSADYVQFEPVPVKLPF
ncbi:ser/threonine protein phosphatase [Alicyclobacillus cellulosilyticus]|uniref:Ser/threonine protein phosphatase n=1 Tax=Alicyclobacillus cellulosilyticus TaxID=1003997 RepID=A0A917KEE6_9BACL|nr:metallophosphoesterase [Alicyclobacillus cellulosilyticus]GGJ10358.1 ser/threonine protein phosphatase [Alicyclobacillus cellulosilyticus]